DDDDPGGGEALVETGGARLADVGRHIIGGHDHADDRRSGAFHGSGFSFHDDERPRRWRVVRHSAHNREAVTPQLLSQESFGLKTLPPYDAVTNLATQYDVER